MIRAVLDTNLVVSYWLTKGETLSRLFDYWEEGRFTYLVSPHILAELREVLNRPHLRRLMAADPAVLLELIEADTELTSGDLMLTGVCRDPKDAPFIACAVEGQAEYLVTGDADLLDLGQYQGVQMIRPYAFVSLLEALP